MTSTITFSAGITEFAITVSTLDDDNLEQEESFTALLSSPSEGLVIGAQDTARVTILDNEGAV